jgi:arylformamidase
MGLGSQWKYLSHPLHPGAPAYGGGNAFFDEPDKQISQGDSCNTRKCHLSNHMGTHIDFPRHFAATGPDLDDYPADFFIFNTIFLADISLMPPGFIIGPENLAIANAPRETELLLIKTGFGQYRKDPLYWQENPGFHPDLADYLRQHFPALRVLGFDSISLSSFTNRNLGRQAHKAFLDNQHPILPLEDMDLSLLDKNSSIDSIIIAPLRVSHADGAPCTVIGKIK